MTPLPWSPAAPPKTISCDFVLFRAIARHVPSPPIESSASLQSAKSRTSPASLEKGGPKAHFAIYLLPEGPCSLERGLLYLPQNDTLRRTIPLVNGSEQPF